MNTNSGVPAMAANDLKRAVAELCVRVPVSAGAAGLARELARLAPRLAFREVLVRGGWYRLGGVVAAGGSRIADDLEHWAATQLAAHGDDLQAFADANAGSALMATRLTGRTHYLVATTGPAAVDFLQVEIEELQEVVCHALFGDEAPTSLEDLIDPLPGAAGKAKPQPLGEPFYALRRITDVAEFLRRLGARKPEPEPVQRFFDAWQVSSAGQATPLCNHWVLAVREHLDRYRQPNLQATPVAALNGLPPRFDGVFGAQGLALHAALQRFDRQAGYPMAWFFHMLTTKTVPHAVASAVIEDVQSGFDYLPERDVSVLKDWLHRPYGF